MRITPAKGTFALNWKGMSPLTGSGLLLAGKATEIANSFTSTNFNAAFKPGVFQRMIKIYLAGPDVFRPDAAAHGEYLKQLCKDSNCEGLYPTDNDMRNMNSDLPLSIRNANVEMIEKCDVVVANLQPFRGPSLDAGTAFEIGYASAKGKPIVGYSKSRGVYTERVIRDCQANRDDEGVLRDAHGWSVEEFALPCYGSIPLIDNLMIARSLHGLTLTVGEAIRRAIELQSQRFNTGSMPPIVV